MQRIEQLKQACERWEDLLERSTKRRDELLILQSEGVSISEDGVNILPKMIDEADLAARNYQRILIRMQSFRDRVINGLET
jgi:hypothetical protein